jgi:hypothetical protein
MLKINDAAQNFVRVLVGPGNLCAVCNFTPLARYL